MFVRLSRALRTQLTMPRRQPGTPGEKTFFLIGTRQGPNEETREKAFYPLYFGTAAAFFGVIYCTATSKSHFEKSMEATQEKFITSA